MRFRVYTNFMFFLVLLMLFQPVQASAYKHKIDDTMVCTYATQKMEKVYQIKQHLLTTIASVETGRWNEEHKQKRAWPWTVNAQGKGTFFNSKAEAVNEVKRLQAQGVKSIDVGCMQINLAYHPDAFDNVEDAFDPQKNVEYAAKFLKNLYEVNDKNWIKAAMSYHSKTPKKALRYKQKIVAAYEAVKKAHQRLAYNLENKNEKENQVSIKDNLKKSASEWREAKLASWRSRQN